MKEENQGSKNDKYKERKYTLKHSKHDDNEPKLSDMLLNQITILPKSFDLLDRIPKVRNQKDQGSCGAYALCYNRELLLSNKNIILSPAFLYYEARKSTGNENDDFGITIKSGLEVLLNIGVSEENKMPYNDKIYNVPPSKEAIENASKFKIGMYANVDNGVMGIKNWIYSKKTGVVFGMDVYEEFNTTSKNGRVPIPSKKSEFLGRHSCCIVGWQTATKKDKLMSTFSRYYSKKGYLICLNSFGEEWGHDGLFLLPYEYLTNAYDFYVITV